MDVRLSDETTQALQDQIKHRLSELHDAVKTVLARMTHSDRALPNDDVWRSLQAIDRLKEVLPSQNEPLWIRPLREWLERVYGPSPRWGTVDGRPGRLLQGWGTDDLFELDAIIQQMRWPDVEPRPDKGFRFADVYQQACRDEEVPRLFDELIDLLEQIINSGVVRLESVREAIDRLIASREANRDGPILDARPTILS